MTTHTLEWTTALLRHMGRDPDTGEYSPIVVVYEIQAADFLPCQELGLEEIDV